jgi:hypothetical protein
MSTVRKLATILIIGAFYVLFPAQSQAQIRSSVEFIAPASLIKIPEGTVIARFTGETTALDAFVDMTTGPDSGPYTFAEMGIYSLSGQITCSDNRPTSLVPLEMEVFTLEGQATGAPVYFMDAVDPATPDDTAPLATVWTFGSNSWVAQLKGSGVGPKIFTIQISPGINANIMQCTGDVTITKMEE